MMWYASTLILSWDEYLEIANKVNSCNTISLAKLV